jgi:hypothetical protein
VSRGGRKRRRRVDKVVKEHRRVFGQLRARAHPGYYGESGDDAPVQFHQVGMVGKGKTTFGSIPKPLFNHVSQSDLSLAQQMAVEALAAKKKAILLDLHGKMKETKFVGVGPKISPELYQQWKAYNEAQKEQISPEVSLLQKFNPHELDVAIKIMGGAHSYLIAHQAGPSGTPFLLGKTVTSQEMAVLTGWANDTEGPPDMVKEYLKLKVFPPDAGKAIAKLLQQEVITVETAKQLMGIKDEPAHPTAQAFEQGYWGSFAPKPGPNPFGDDIGDSED